MKRTALNVLFSMLLASFAFTTMSAQGPQTGTFPFGSYTGGPDVVDLLDNNVQWTIPIRHKPGRGSNFDYDLVYNSSIWTPVTSGSTTTWQPVYTKTVAGWQGLLPAGNAYITYSMSYSSGTCGQFGDHTWQTWNYGGFTYWDSAYHSFSISGIVTTVSPSPSNQCPPAQTQPAAPWTAAASDGSGFTMYVTPGQGTVSAYVIDKSGTRLNVPVTTNPSGQWGSQSTVDINGNKITSSNGSYTDTMNKTVLGVSGTVPSPTLLSYAAPSGATATFTVSYKQYTVATNFAVSGISEYGATSTYLVDKITLPDGTFYQFNYEATPSTPSSGACTPLPGTTCVTARIYSVTVPTGGTFTYTYSGGDSTNNSGIFSDGRAATLQRQTPDGTWTYALTRGTGTGTWTNMITAPQLPYDTAANQTVVQFSPISYNGFTIGTYETQRQVYQGAASGTPLVTTTTSYPTQNNFITERDVTTQLGAGIQSLTIDKYDNNNNLTEHDIYDWANGTPTILLQKTLITLAYACGPAGKPTSITVQDAAGNILSKTSITYDQGTPATSSGTPQHTTGMCGNVLRLLPTTVSTTVHGTTTLSKTFTYYDTGMIKTATDVNGAVTTYNYPDATSTCGNTFATSVTLPVIGTTPTTTFNCNGAVATQSKDLNGNATNITYNDPYFWRTASVQDPMPATTSYTYTKYTSSTSPARVESKLPFNGSPATSLVEQLTTLDGLGRAIYSQSQEGPGSANYDSTQAFYDVLGRPYQGTMPCVTGVGQGCPSAAKTTSNFDALRRVVKTTDGGTGYVQSTFNQNDVLQAIGPAPAGENLKQKQLEYDGLGRLTKVCEMTSLPGYGVCSMQASTPNGYLTTYAYSVNASAYATTTVTQNAQAVSGHQTRVYTYDMLGRLISEQNPENATVNYTYDTDSSGTCNGTYNGDLVKLVDAKGNTICYKYDSLHRNTSITYPTGPDSANTPSKTFVYDSATFNGTAMSNPKGQLVEAYTGAVGSKTTDEFFSYSVRGELVDTWQCTPHSGTNGCASVSNYYHVTAGFWENGALKTLSSSITNLPTQNYVVDAMGRPKTVSAGAGQNPVSDTVYDLVNFKTTVTYGSADSDVVTLDPNTGRMTQYKFNVNGQNVTGNLTWNANGSLVTLGITNQLNSLDTQTCNYTHDDLQRISSVGCLNGATHRWDQNFTYDAFGNITKQVPVGGTGINFLPTYDTSKNWITALPGASPATDPNGRMTNDGAHTYTWDADNKMHSVDANPSDCSTSGQCLTYDALGRMVEKAVSSTYTQIVYGPQGRFATMNGQTLVKAFIPLPGAQAIYTAASLNTTNKVAYYRHADHLGSSRLATTPTRTLYSSTAYAPFGEPYSQSGTTDLSFTGQEQDTVSGMYDFLFRKYTPTQGRWLSPDPAGMAAVDATNPQSWNRYAYVINNPMSFTDPLGESIQYRDGCYYFLRATLTYTNGSEGFIIHEVPELVNVMCLSGNGSFENTSCPPGVTCGDTGGHSTGGAAWAGLVFWKMKNKPIDSGPLNKTFQQPPERNPIEEMLKKIQEKKEMVENATEVLLEALKKLSEGGTFMEVPMFKFDPCYGTGGTYNIYRGKCESAPLL